MTLVLTTSKGVVNAPAIPPATDPHIAAWPGEGLFPSRYRIDICRFRASYNGNWIDVNGSYSVSLTSLILLSPRKGIETWKGHNQT